METLLNQYVTARVINGGTPRYDDPMVHGKVINISNDGKTVFILATAYIQPHYVQALARNCTPDNCTPDASPAGRGSHDESLS